MAKTPRTPMVPGYVPDDPDYTWRIPQPLSPTEIDPSESAPDFVPKQISTMDLNEQLQRPALPALQPLPGVPDYEPAAPISLVDPNQPLENPGANYGAIQPMPALQPRQNFLDKIGSKPGLAEALMSSGAAMMKGGQGFGDAIANGVSTFNTSLETAQDKRLKRDAEALAAARDNTKLSGDGQWTQTFDPKTRQWVQTPNMGVMAYRQAEKDADEERARERIKFETTLKASAPPGYQYREIKTVDANGVETTQLVLVGGPNSVDGAEQGQVVAQSPEQSAAAPGSINPSAADVVYGHGRYGSPSQPLSSMTMGQVQDFQRNTLIPATRGKVGAGPEKGTGAVGAWQITHGTLAAYAPQVFGANWQAVPFTLENQDKIAEAIWNDARKGNLRQTWASLPNNRPGEYANVPWSQMRDRIAVAEGTSRAAPASNRATVNNGVQVVASFRTDNGDGPAQVGDITKTGPAYLATIPQEMRNTVKAISEGRMALPSGKGLATPYWQKVLTAVTQYDPTFDASNATTRVATRKDFTSGKASRAVSSLNLVMGHLQTLKTKSEALDNSSFTPWNSVANAVSDRVGSPEVKNFNAAKQAVASELMKVFRDTGGTLTEVEDWKSTIDSSSSPAQFKGVIKTAVELIRSRLDALRTQYNQGMGRSDQEVNFLNPHARKAWDSIQAWANDEKPTRTAQAKPSTAPRPRQTQKGWSAVRVN